MPDVYDPNDEQYLSTAERLNRRIGAGAGHLKKWFSSVGNDIAMGVPVYAAGAGLSTIPWGPAKGLGTLGKVIGGQMMTWAPITATRTTVDDITKPVEPPQTDAQHLKKWFKNTGTGVGIGLGVAGAGKVISLLPVPGARLVGVPMIGAGLLASKWAPIEATGELWYDKLFRNGKPRPVQPASVEPKIDRTPNYIGAGITGLAGLGGAYALTGLIPALRKRRALRMAAAMAAAAGAGYWGWKESDKARGIA